MTLSDSESGWIASSIGDPPEIRWSFATDATLVDLAVAREAGRTYAADATGGIYLFDRHGHVDAVSRGFAGLSALAVSDTAETVAAVVHESWLCRLNRRLEVAWAMDLPDTILAIAVEPFGEYIAASLANGTTKVFDSSQQIVGTFETGRSLKSLAFVATRPLLIGSADYGLLCAYGVRGELVWSEALFSSIGDMAITGDGQSIYLAGFSHGVLAFDGTGRNRGSYVVEGTPHRVSSSFSARRVCAVTLERHFYWIDAGGEMLWAAVLPDDAVRVHCSPIGNGAVCGLTSGRVLHLQWV